MYSLANLDTYNGDTEYDMWVDFDNENPGSFDVSDEYNLDGFIDNLNEYD